LHFFAGSDGEELPILRRRGAAAAQATEAPSEPASYEEVSEPEVSSTSTTAL